MSTRGDPLAGLDQAGCGLAWARWQVLAPGQKQRQKDREVARVGLACCGLRLSVLRVAGSDVLGWCGALVCTAAEHAAEAARLGGAEAYRVRMVNALMGAVQTQVMLADAVELDEQARHAAWREQLTSAGTLDDPVVRVGFIRWQMLRAEMPSRLIAQNPETGPIPVAAAHAAEGLHVLLG